MATGNIQLHFRAATVSDAKEKALTRLREITEDESIQLPWSAHFNLVGAPDEFGTDDGLLNVAVSMELTSLQLDGTEK